MTVNKGRTIHRVMRDNKGFCSKHSSIRSRALQIGFGNQRFNNLRHLHLRVVEGQVSSMERTDMEMANNLLGRQCKLDRFSTRPNILQNPTDLNSNSSTDSMAQISCTMSLPNNMRPHLRRRTTRSSLINNSLGSLPRWM